MKLIPIPLVLTLATSISGQQITRVSAATIGQNMEIDYTSTPTDVFVMYHSFGLTGGLFVPGFGTFYLDVGTFSVLYAGGVPGGGTHTRVQAVPNDVNLIGLCNHIQALNIVGFTTFAFSNTASYCFNRSIGKLLISEGPLASAAFGDRVMKLVTDGTAGAPGSVDLSGSGLFRHASQPITHHGLEGFTPLVATGDLLTPMAEHHVDTILVPSRDQRDPEVPNVKLPNGFDLHVVRDQLNPKTFHLVSVERATATARILTGTTFTDAGSGTHPPSIYLSQFAFTPAGDVALAVVHDSTNRPNPNVGPADRILLVKTDPAQLWTNGLNGLDVSGPVGPNRIHTALNGTLRIGNGRGFVAGSDPGVAGSALWHGPTSGLVAFARLTVPNTGTGLPWFWDYGEWRMNAAGTTGLFAIGGNSAFPQSDMDYIALTGIGPVVAPVATNITAFAFATRVMTPGRDGLGGTNLRAALSPDGLRAAFIVGSNVGPGTGVALALTSGANAGAVVPFTTGAFDAQVVTFGEVHWLTNTRLLFTAGSSDTAMDYYVRDVIAGTTTNLTTTTTGSTVAPFTQGGNTGDIRVLGSFFSDNRALYYFCRGVGPAGPHNWVGIRTTLALLDVTGGEFAGGAASATRLVTPLGQTMQLRRRPGTGHVVFIAGRDRGASWGDDEVWRFDAEAGGAAVQLSSHNAVEPLTTLVRRIDDLVVQPTGTHVAFAQGIGTSAARPENVFVVPAAGGATIKRGGIRFTGPDLGAGVAWIQGTDSRTTPVVDAVALWNSIPPLAGGVLVRLTSPPATGPRFLSMIVSVR
jgi:hypothetical protein